MSVAPMVTVWAVVCQPAAMSSETAGAVVSICGVSVCGVSVLPAPSVDQ